MIIQNLDTKHFRIPLRTSMTDSTHGKMTHFEVVMVIITADEGSQGIKYTYTVGQGVAAIKSLINEAYKPLLEG